MARGLFVIVIAFLAAGSSSVCIAQDRATGDSGKLTRQEWQSRVNATRERLEQQREKLRLEREKRNEPKRDDLQRGRETQQDLRHLN